MPSRNRTKVYLPDCYYHVYNRGVEKRNIFQDKDDYTVFLSLFKRYLSGKKSQDSIRRPYDDMSSEIELLSYCLMPNHFHLLFYQFNAEALTKLMRRTMTSYTMYFNKKYRRVGNLFQDRYKATNIDNDNYLLHISRYIHLNPLDINERPETYDSSSYKYYVGGKTATWIKPQRILELHKGSGTYRSFISDYEGHKQILDEIKTELADYTGKTV